MLFLFNASIQGDQKAQLVWLSEGVNRTNGARLIDDHGMTYDPTAHESHNMSPRGSWGRGNDTENDEDDYETEAAYEAAKAVEWRCGFCGATSDTAEALAPCKRA
jgi:hypothetical protein